MQELHFIPTPVSVTEGDGIFTVTRDITIVLPAAADNDDLFSVKRLQEGIIKYLGFHGSVEKRFTGKQSSSNITLLRADRDATWLPTDMPSLHQQGYHLRVTTDAILLIGADAAGLFYAVETLLQLLDQAGNAVPAIEITDYPALPNRGVMLDISRGKVPTVDTLLHIVDLLASWKINQFQLYIEHTFAWPSHPKIGKGYDPLTPGDIITIDKACAKRHINFVPNLQSFGHQHHMLQRKEYAPLAETDMRWTLSPAEPGTYTLLDELFAEFLPNFRSTVFNIDSDETYDLGKGKSASMVAEKGLGCVYLDHILKLRDMAARYGRQIMFWGDIILHHPELITSIPDDVTVLEWQYGEFPNEDHVRQFAEAGKKFYVCPGTNSWRAIFPRQQEARGNISRMAQYAIKYGAIGMLNTDWGDGGHFNLQGLSYYGYAFGAAESWNPGTTTDFDTAFGRLFFGPEDGAKVMEAMKHLETITRPTAETFIADIVMLHTGFLTGSSYREKLTPEVVAVMKSHAQQAFNLVKSLRGHTRHPLTISELYQAAYQDLLLAEKAEAAVNFHRQYAELQAHGDSEGLTQLAKDTRKVLKALVIKAEKVPDIFAPLWHARARLAGLSENIEYQMEVIEDLQASAEWISKAVKTAKKAGMLPALPAIDDHWEPKCMRAQVG